MNKMPIVLHDDPFVAQYMKGKNGLLHYGFVKNHNI
ncbi:hypothetical protein KOY_02144 [Bacillus cereus VDM021]|nr:hypothetical protein IIW_03279 [Bacillus cereus VD136]EOP65645.1 hypothetical protein KOW_02008 [Bacillus cereus VDM006]EOQ02410.1 hypothetical protein KOY_02144 [Bacillus cereus VDM021]